MAAVHLPQYHAKPYTPHKVQGKTYLCNICSCRNKTVYARFEVLELPCRFLYGLFRFSSAIKSYGKMKQSPCFYPRRILNVDVGELFFFFLK